MHLAFWRSGVGHAAIAAMALASAACSHDGEAPPTTPPSAPAAGDPVVKVEDDGKTFDLATGGSITFKLASNGGTGYSWTPVGVDAKVLAQQGETTSEVQTPGLPGGPKLDVLKFLAVAPGSVDVEMDLKRAFGNDPPGKVVKVHVRVK